MRGEGLLFESEDGRSRFLVHIGMPPVVVGRQPPYEPQNVRVASSLVSRRHACITCAPNGYTVDDAGSSGGTWLDGARVAGPTPLTAGARLQLTGDVAYVARTFAGHSLYDLHDLSEGEPVAMPAALAMARDVLRALRPLHQAGESHGNLDPHHIIYEEAGHGWTVLIDGWTVLDPDGVLGGNPVYVAPEVFADQALVTGSDLYTLGLVLFETLSGRRYPEWGTTPPPRALADLLQRMLSSEPRERPDVTRAIELIYELRPELRLP